MTPARLPAAPLTLAGLATAGQVPAGMLRQAAELGLLPTPDSAGGRWSTAQPRAILDAWPQTAAKVQDAADLGASRSAGLLARLTGLPITPAHIDTLAARGMLASSRLYRRRPLYRVTDIQALAADPAGRALLAGLAAGQDGRP